MVRYSRAAMIVAELGGEEVAECDVEALDSAYAYAYRLTRVHRSAAEMAVVAYRRLVLSDRAERPPRNRRAFLMASVNQQYLAPLSRRLGW